MSKFYILRDCKKTGIEVRLRPDFDDINDAKANADILKAGDKDSIYWVRPTGPSEMESLVRKSLAYNPGRVFIIGDATPEFTMQRPQ